MPLIEVCVAEFRTWLEVRQGCGVTFLIMQPIYYSSYVLLGSVLNGIPRLPMLPRYKTPFDCTPQPAEFECVLMFLWIWGRCSLHLGISALILTDTAPTAPNRRGGARILFGRHSVRLLGVPRHDSRSRFHYISSSLASETPVYSPLLHHHEIHPLRSAQCRLPRCFQQRFTYSDQPSCSCCPRR